MAHTHDVYDMENHFEINGSSRFIKETSETKLVVVQGDHKSEVLTFKMPRYIDGHDMTLCNKIRIHYINLDTKTNNKSADVYEVTDLTLCKECEDVLTFTWTIEAPATKYSGTLSFLVKFECTEGENVLYQWNTAKYVSVNVLAGIDNSEEFVEKYSNVLEEWYNELTRGADSIEELNQQALSEIELAKEDAKEDIQDKADTTMAEMNSYSANAYNSFKNNVDAKASETLASIPEDYSDLDAEVKFMQSELGITPIFFEYGKYNITTGNKQASTSTVRNKALIKLDAGTVIKSNRFMTVIYYSDNVASSANFVKTGANQVYRYTVPEEYANCYIGIHIAVEDSATSGLTADESANGTGFQMYIPPLHKPIVQENMNYKFLSPDYMLGVSVGINKFPNHNILHDDIGYYIPSDGPGNVVHKTYTNSAGTIVYNAVTPYFKVNGGATYSNCTTSKASGCAMIQVSFYDENYEYVGFKQANNSSTNHTFTTPDNAYWCRISFDYTLLEYMQLYEGDVYEKDGEYRPYEIIFDKPIDWDSTEPNEDFRTEIEDTVDEVLNLSDIGMVRFLHVTDTHIGTKLGKNHAMCFKSMIEVANRIGADFILHTGDVLTGGNGDADAQKSALLQMTEIFSDCNIPIIVSRGNHDDNSIAGLTEENIVFNSWWNNHMNKAINNQSRHFVFPENDNGYFYYDIPEKRIRVVNINSSDLTDEERLSTGGQNFAKISQAQLEWLDTEALIVNDNWKIICASHISCASTQPNMAISNASDLYNLLTKYKGNIIAYIYGHTHVNANYVDSSTGIRFISACTCGGSVVNYLQNGRNTSYASAEAKKTSPTGAMLFDVCILGYDDNISKVRWGVHDDVQGN